MKIYTESGNNMYSLVRGNTILETDRKLTETEKNFLLHLLLTPNRVSIGTAIRKLKQMDILGRLESPTSIRTLRRWCEEWESNNKAEWNLLRNGKKALQEKSIKSILRSNELDVGQVWVADGHQLAFDIINPATGKPKRMTMIMFYDWASRYPVGAALASSEDSQHILLALRNSILNWGGKPKYVYLDNGRAFKSKLFNKQWDKHDLSKELAGIFPRMGIGVVFAEAYNARAKVIERFFLTFQNDFERFMTTFRGASIADKPATLMRNEKWMKKLFEGKPLTVKQAKSMITLYIEQMYGLTPHGGLNGAKPFEVFTEAEVPQEQKIDPSELNFLMLAVANRKVSASGIRFNNAYYWDEALINHVGDKITIRYDLMDVRSILIYDSKSRFICQANIRKLQHPFVHLAPDKATSQKELAQELSHIRKLEKNIKESSEQIMLKVSEAVGAIQLPEPVTTGELFSDKPLIEQAQSELTIDDIVKAVHENDPVEPIIPKDTSIEFPK
ncbi:MAG: transposase family protein [Candidatus Cloacimonetes bacterium]|nr:transposase family protein [Candidatus Cloacimonadota bacterium]